MKNDDLLQKLKQDYNNIKVNEKGIEIMKKSINEAKKQKQNRAKWTGVAVACVAAFIIAPNVSPTIAMGMSKIPVISSIVNVITLNKYSDQNKNLDVDLPIVKDDSDLKNIYIESINKNIDDYVKDLITQFEKDFSQGDNKSLDITYNVISNTDKILSIQILGLETSASGYQFTKVYNLDKLTGQLFELKSLFKDDADYINILSENIKSQMREQMAKDESKVYFIDSKEFPEDDFNKIKPEQNFYLDSNNNLVILFNEYEVAPGSMGAVQFTINTSDIKDYLK